MLYKKGTHRPMTMGIQVALGINADGFHGDDTSKAIMAWQSDHNLKKDGVIGSSSFPIIAPDIPLEYKILEMIGVFEGINSKKNAWGYTSKIGDGAGRNWGIMQVNRLGSLKNMKKLCGFSDERAWFGTVASAKGQMDYFRKYILKWATEYISDIPKSSPRLLAVVCDSITQGGKPYLSKQPKTWEYWKLCDGEKKRVQSVFKMLESAKEAFKESMKTSCCDPAWVFAELQPTGGRLKYIQDQFDRRRATVYGKGIVHGSRYDMEKDFGF